MTHDATSGLNYTFDQENRLTGAAGYTYTYAGDGSRVRKSNGNLAANGTLYWDMTPGVVAETDLAGTLKSEYVFFDGERVARRDGPTGTGGVFYYFSDHLKTASVITDSAGVIKAESDYYPWGGELQFVNNDSNHYKFTGKERDTETGLDYFGARYYSNGLGRFITPDWAAKATAVAYADFSDPQTLNLYNYVRSIPTTRYDADGHCADTTNCQKLPNNPANVPAPVKQAINDSVKASNGKNSDDTKGGSHEEGGVAYTQNGKQTVAPAEPGKAKDVTTPGHPEIDPYKAADPSKAKPGDVQADVVWHVHPSAVVETSTPNTKASPGTTVIGGTTTVETSFFIQTPSPVDIQNATPAPTVNIVVGAQNKTVYVYDSKGCTCQESLKDFNKEPKQ
jgi:RHS repeat-associated protein